MKTVHCGKLCFHPIVLEYIYEIKYSLATYIAIQKNSLPYRTQTIRTCLVFASWRKQIPFLHSDKSCSLVSKQRLHVMLFYIHIEYLVGLQP